MTDPLPISSKPRCERADALAVLRRLREAGHIAYFAGGCVRDELMGLVPKDYDIATDAQPQRVRELFTNTQAVGAAFGVILVRHRGSVVEVATFRTDVSYEDGRRPTSVRFTTAEEDARRRDFTINGLFLDPIDNRVIDYVGGQQDIRDRILRAIGNPNERFAEDHLRLLRAVRFAARFDLTIEEKTSAAIAHHAPHLARISPERIAEELRLVLVPITRAGAWQLLVRLGLLPVVLREFPQNPQLASVDDGSRPLFPELAPAREVAFGLALAALVWCYRCGSVPPLALTTRAEARRSVAACRKLLRISNEEANLMHQCLEIGLFLEDDRPPTTAMLKRLMSRSCFGEIRLMIEAFGASGHFVPRVTWLLREFDQLADSELAPPPLLTGDELVARGLTPGPAFKRALDFVYDEQLEGRVTSREQALELGEIKVREFESRTGPAR